MTQGEAWGREIGAEAQSRMIDELRKKGQRQTLGKTHSQPTPMRPMTMPCRTNMTSQWALSIAKSLSGRLLKL
jgi:hypothetical protein